MNISIHFYLLNLIALVLLLLSSWIFLRYQKSLGILSYAGFLLGLAIIASATAFSLRDYQPQVIRYFILLGYTGSVVTSAMMLMFSWHFPVPSRNLPKQHNLFWIVPFVFFIPFIWFNSNFLININNHGLDLREIHGWSFWIFPMFMFTYVIWSIINLIRKLTHVDQGRQFSIRLFIWLIIILSLVAMIFDTLLPATGHPRIPIGTYTTCLVFGLSFYIVTSK